jgi:hypothetical protein
VIRYNSIRSRFRHWLVWCPPGAEISAFAFRRIERCLGITRGL